MAVIRHFTIFLFTTVLLSASLGHAADRPKRNAAVPPGLEIEVLDPGVDPLGNPAVISNRQPGAEVTIEIPPTVLVHRFYYTGDRKFQGPMLAGGPAIVVVNHPKTAERTYLDIQLLPGAPRVIYSSKSIEYDYGKQGITLWFGCTGTPRVLYRNHKPPGRVLGDASAKVAKGAHHLIEQSGVGDLAGKVKEGAKNVSTAAVDGARNAGTAVLTPIAQAAQVVPGVKMLTPSATDRASNTRDRAVSRAADAKAGLDDSIRTIR